MQVPFVIEGKFSGRLYNYFYGLALRNKLCAQGKALCFL